MLKILSDFPAISEGKSRAGDRQRKDRDDGHRVLERIELRGQDHVGDRDPEEKGEYQAVHGLPEGEARASEDDPVADGQILGQTFDIADGFVLRMPGATLA